MSIVRPSARRGQGVIQHQDRRPHDSALGAVSGLLRGGSGAGTAGDEPVRWAGRLRVTYVPIRDERGRDLGAVGFGADGSLRYYQRERDVPANDDGTARHLLPVTPEQMLRAVAMALMDSVGTVATASIVSRATNRARSA